CARSPTAQAPMDYW
nr:immunoglobulin heavy chain junction region [Mus musculus]